MEGTWFFFFNDTATTEIYTLSLHDALPILARRGLGIGRDTLAFWVGYAANEVLPVVARLRRWWRGCARSCSADRKSTRLNSSHANISYAVFCLKKKNNLLHIHKYTLSASSL